MLWKILKLRTSRRGKSIFTVLTLAIATAIILLNNFYIKEDLSSHNNKSLHLNNQLSLDHILGDQKPYKEKNDNINHFDTNLTGQSAQGVVVQKKNGDHLEIQGGDTNDTKRVWEYCNLPTVPFGGNEGIVEPGYHLEHVHIILRHGSRSPMFKLPSQGPRLACDIKKDELQKDPRLQKYVTRMRMAEAKSRWDSMAKRLHMFPQSRMCEGSQLTSSGTKQHLNNGEHLNNVYIKKWKLLEENFDPADIHFRSTAYSRTYQSLTAFLYGFLPSLDFSRLKVGYSQGVNFCSTEFTGMDCACPNLLRLQEQSQTTSSKRLKNDTMDVAFKKKIAKTLGAEVNKLPWSAAIVDVLSSRLCNGGELPCSPTQRSQCVTFNMLQNGWKLQDRNGQLQLSLYVFQKFSRLSMHPLLHEIMQRLRNITRGMERTKAVVYSGHDTTLTPMLVALGLHNGKWPPFGSRFVIEFYSKTLQEGGKNYYIRTLLNGVDKTKFLQFCKTSLVDGLCPLPNFMRFVIYEDLQYFAKSSYEQACA